jgi:Na+/melibiose symporter-like transporter
MHDIASYICSSTCSLSPMHVSFLSVTCFLLFLLLLINENSLVPSRDHSMEVLFIVLCLSFMILLQMTYFTTNNRYITTNDTPRDRTQMDQSHPY